MGNNVASRRAGLVAAGALGAAAVAELAYRTTLTYPAPGSPGALGSGPAALSHQILRIGDTALNAQSAIMVYVLALAATALPALLSPGAALGTAGAANLASIGIFHTATGAAGLGQLIVAYRLGAAGGRAAAALAGLPFLALAIAAANPPGAETGAATMLLAGLVPAAALAGLAQRSRAETLAENAARETIASTQLGYALRGERARIARELHDVVAHHISMVAVQAETARLTTPGMPEIGARRLLAIGDTARAALTEMRRLLGILRDDDGRAATAADGAGDAADSPGATGATGEPEAIGAPASTGRRPGAGRQPQPGLEQLNDLLDGAREAAGTGVRLIITGSPARLEPGVELAAYRIIQEALTNARRHARGAAVDVELHYGRNALRLRVRDNGPGEPGVTSPSGHGLVGMRERAAAVGGQLRAGPAQLGGFLVEAALPAAPAAPVLVEEPIDVLPRNSPARPHR
ncbi:MAG: sensor histidine kinase [Frankiaceae bacterium]|nr:sensor histidine kinase [Frankiaceae bacterium]